jgi:hypothetical protein
MTHNITTLDIQHNDSQQNYIKLDTKPSNIYHNDPSIIKLDAYLVFVLLSVTRAVSRFVQLGFSW